MSRSIAAGLALSVLATAGCQSAATGTAPQKTLSAFASEAQLEAFLKRLASADSANKGVRRVEITGSSIKPASPMMAAPAPVAELKVAAGEESVTNTQTAGVDEGGIVKVHGKHLVMLRRGRLFTVDISGDRLAPVAAIDAYAPDTDPRGTWYDEMLISGNTVAVIGYSYSRGGTEIGLFDIDADGRLSYRSTWHMRANDYYSSSNYASRQIGSKLVFYSPLRLNPWATDPLAAFPALRKWRSGATPAEFRRIAPATRIYRTDAPLEPDQGLTLHTVTVCDLATREMTCEASAVLGAQSEVFYMSGQSVYVWAGPSYGSADAGLFRMPLDGGAPSALKVTGSPVNQFSFLESGDGHLNVLVRSSTRGIGARGQRPRGELALMRVALRSFSDGRDSVPAASYKALPAIGGYGFQNRFVGDWLLYGGAGGAGRAPLHALRWDGTGQTLSLAVPHGVERIEAMGDGALAIGSNGADLHFSSVSLGSEAALANRYVRANAAQGETRSHGFFYKSEGAGEGIAGLPLISGDDGGGRRRTGGAASVLYLRNTGLSLTELGSLKAHPDAPVDDGCRASCVDWYGNARPLFLKGRLFALMGYELVEGKLRDGRVSETRRISYAPGSVRGTN